MRANWKSNRILSIYYQCPNSHQLNLLYEYRINSQAFIFGNIRLHKCEGMLDDHLLDILPFSGRTSRLKLSIAGTSCSIISQDSYFINVLQEHYRRFESSGRAVFDIVLKIVPFNSFSSDDINPIHYPPVKRVNYGNNFLLKQIINPFIAVANTSSKKVLVKMEPSQACFDIFLRMLYTLILAEEGGLLLHGYTKNEKGRANVFFYPPDNSEPTVARLSKKSNFFTDEQIIIKPHKNRFRVYKTPFSTEYGADRTNSRALLQGIYSLKDGQSDIVLGLDKIKAMMSLYRCVSFFTDDSRLLRRIFTTCCNIIDTVPAYELNVRPDWPSWPTMIKLDSDRYMPVHT